MPAVAAIDLAPKWAGVPPSITKAAPVARSRPPTDVADFTRMWTTNVVGTFK
jgi:hypothetical protein